MTAVKVDIAAAMKQAITIPFMPTGMYSAITVGSTSSGSITLPVVIP